MACGQCKTGTTCNVMNGDCPEGCQSGWAGANCTADAIGQSDIYQKWFIVNTNIIMITNSET